MDIKRRSALASAIVLILLGVWFLAIQIVPSLKDWAFDSGSWPLAIVAAGGILLIIALVTWVPAMAVPAFIVGGIGVLLYWQNSTGNWGSWAYAWTLIPGFIGLGVFVSGLLSRERNTVLGGLGQMAFSAVLFVVFSSFLGGPVDVGRYWPVAIIFLGVWVFFETLLKPRPR